MNAYRCWRAARLGRSCALLALVVAASGVMARAALASPAPASAGARTWDVTVRGSHVRINYGSGRRFPRYADLDKSSGYFRMVNSTASGWGTSVILLPSLWSATSCPTDYCQGGPVKASWHKAGANLVLVLHGTIATLKVTVTLTLTPPARGTFVARVSAKVTGTVTLDSDRPGEAFKPVMLSSMHDSPTIWDSSDAFIGTTVYQFPASGWIIQPPVTARDFGLQGGTSSWKKDAPTIEVTLAKSRQVTGWLTTDANPNDDNVGFWCAASTVLHSWTFTVTAEAGGRL